MLAAALFLLFLASAENWLSKLLQRRNRLAHFIDLLIHLIGIHLSNGRHHFRNEIVFAASVGSFSAEASSLYGSHIESSSPSKTQFS